MADTSLIFNIIARDKTEAAFKKMQARASGLGATVGMALGPALVPVAAVGGAAVTSFGMALGAAGVAAGVFGAVTKTAMTEVSQNATKLSDLRDKMKLYGKEADLAAADGRDNASYLKKQVTAATELRARLALLPPETRNATQAYMDMGDSWQGFVDHNKPATFNILASGYKILNSAIGQLQPLFDIGARAASRLTASIGGWVTGGGISRIAKAAAPAMDSLVTIITNLGTVFGRVFGRMGTGQGQSALNWIANMTSRWKDWSASTNQKTGINKFFEYLSSNGPKVGGLLLDIAKAAMQIAKATAPIAPVSLAIASALAKIIAAIPPNMLTALIGGFIAFNVAMKAWSVIGPVVTAVQWAYNAALSANPIALIIIAVIALIGFIVYLATKTKFFQTVWGAVWGFIKTVGLAIGQWFAGPFAGFFVSVYKNFMIGLKQIGDFFVSIWNWIKGVGIAIGGWFAGPFAGFFVATWNKMVAGFNWLKNGFMTVVNFIKGLVMAWVNLQIKAATTIVNAGVKIVNWFTSMPGRIKGALSNMFAPLWTGFKGIVNRVIGAWNNLSFTIGGGSFGGVSLPSVTLNTPNVPYMASGGKILRDGLLYGHAGEQVTKKAVVSRTGAGTGSQNGGGGAVITIEGSNSKVVRVLMELLREGIRDQGGDVVKVLTPR